MFSVFLVEDEIIIREGIKNLIAWDDYGFIFAGEATDGEVAWPLIQKRKPDIVITDIKMPFMDGLTLSRLIRRELPDTTIIILSGYDEFSYAREAISIGISEYLLKPLSRDQLIEVLCQIREQKEKEQDQRRHMARFNAEMQNYLASSRRDFFETLVSGRYSASELLERTENLGLNLAAERYNIVLFLLEEDLLHTEYSSQLGDAQSALCDCFVQEKNVAMFSMGVDMTAFLVMSEADAIEDNTARCVESIQNLSLSMEKAVNWSVVTGKPVKRLSAVADCYRSARKQLFRIDTGTSDRANSRSFMLDFNPNDMDATKLDQRIIAKFLANGLPDDLDGFVQDFFCAMGEKSVQSLLFRQYVVLHIQFSVNAFLERLDCTPEALKPSGDHMPRLQDSVNSLEGAKKYVRWLLERALFLRDQAVNSRYAVMLQKALNYMRENYADPNLSLNTVALVANVSPTHFCAIFSHQMEKTFVEYLTELRMERARELLCCTDMRSREIAPAVGYNDPHYFSFLFKKMNGSSPRDYRAGRRAT
ncbi:MAG TPA: response regulator [Clostridia bacterium]|nr:response regulator [Clostridia bacterium]